MRGISAAFDDTKVAQLLATALALDGQASDRLATIFNTIAPDDDRKRRVMTLTRNMLSETDFGRSGQFQVLWTSMEELLVSYNDKPFVSESYRASLDGMGARAERLAATELPPELSAWMDTLGQENVRSLSVTLLIDLLSLEEDHARASDIAHDMEALAEDLLMSGAYADATVVTGALAERAARAGAIGRDGCRLALDQLGESLAMRETVSLVGDVDEQAWQAIRDLITRVGPSTVEALRALMLVENDTVAATRAGDPFIVAFGKTVVTRLAPLVGDPRWFVQRTGARLLEPIGRPKVCRSCSRSSENPIRAWRAKRSPPLVTSTTRRPPAPFTRYCEQPRASSGPSSWTRSWRIATRASCRCSRAFWMRANPSAKTTKWCWRHSTR